MTERLLKLCEEYDRICKNMHKAVRFGTVEEAKKVSDEYYNFRSKISMDDYEKILEYVTEGRGNDN